MTGVGRKTKKRSCNKTMRVCWTGRPIGKGGGGVDMATRVLPAAAAAASPRRQCTKGLLIDPVREEKRENGRASLAAHTASFMGGNEADASGIGKERTQKPKEREEGRAENVWCFHLGSFLSYLCLERDNTQTYSFGVGAQPLVKFLDGNLVVVNVQLLFQLVQVFLALFSTRCSGGRTSVLSPKLERQNKILFFIKKTNVTR